MFRSTAALSLALLALPLALLTTACGGSDEPEPLDVGGAGNGGASNAAGASNGGSATNGGGAGTAGSTNNGGEAGAGGTTNGGASNGGSANGSGGTSSASGGSAPLEGGELGPAPVPLGDAGDFVVLAQSAISNVPTSAITGDLGLSPAAASYITGFTLTRAGDNWTTPEVTGEVFAADSDDFTPAELTGAVADMGTAYVDAANRPSPAFLNLGDGAIGGLTLQPGLYRWTSTVTIPADVTLAGGAEDTWLFQITGDLTMAASQRMTLSGGARAENIVWQVAGEVSFAATSHAEGIVLSKTAIHLGTGASINGRLLAQTAVTLQSNAITAP